VQTVAAAHRAAVRAGADRERDDHCGPASSRQPQSAVLIIQSTGVAVADREAYETPRRPNSGRIARRRLVKSRKRRHIVERSP
jgi:hypothetical protein